MVTKQARSEVRDRLWHKGAEFAIYQAKKILHESGITKPPFPPERLAALRGIKILKEDLGNLDSLLLPLDDSFEIKINATHSPSRQNFSCAHEIAHTFFFEEEGRVLIERLTREEGKKMAKNWEENLCDIAASEMLMPSQIFSGYASRYHFGIHALTLLSRTFEASIQPIVLKLCDVHPNHCLVLNWAIEKSNALGDLRLRATWLTWSRMRLSSRAGRFSFKPKLFGEFSSVLKAYNSDIPTYSRQRIGVGNFRGYCRMESQAFNSGEDRFVISLIIPEPDN
jgi:Zn-dependent peptidase ImmA (M78 family)